MNENFSAPQNSRETQSKKVELPFKSGTLIEVSGKTGVVLDNGTRSPNNVYVVTRKVGGTLTAKDIGRILESSFNTKHSKIYEGFLYNINEIKIKDEV